MSDRGRRKVSIHARVSTDDKGQGPLNQILELREFASRQGWTVVREYADEATAILRTTKCEGSYKGGEILTPLTRQPSKQTREERASARVSDSDYPLSVRRAKWGARRLPAA